MRQRLGSLLTAFPSLLFPLFLSPSVSLSRSILLTVLYLDVRHKQTLTKKGSDSTPFPALSFNLSSWKRERAVFPTGFARSLHDCELHTLVRKAINEDVVHIKSFIVPETLTSHSPSRRPQCSCLVLCSSKICVDFLQSRQQVGRDHGSQRPSNLCADLCFFRCDLPCYLPQC